MQSTFRQSKLTNILSQLMSEEIIEMLSQAQNFTKEMFFKNLSPLEREAFKITFQVIEEEYHVLDEHEDDKIQENWFAHFVAYHDELIGYLKEDVNKPFVYAIDLYGQDFINDVFRQDARKLEEIMDFVGEKYIEAVQLNEQRSKALHEKLQGQLNDVVNTLKELTIADGEGIKEFEIGIEDAMFDVTIKYGEKCSCCSDDMPSFEEFMKMVLGDK